MPQNFNRMIVGLNTFYGLDTDPLPDVTPRDISCSHAPRRNLNLTPSEKRQAVKNALRYFPVKCHSELAQEFADELANFGHIYMYRFMPKAPIQALPFESYVTRCKEGAAIMLMIQNNLDPRIAQFPHELVTYGGNGTVFSNWAQYQLTMKYLSEMSESQTLVLSSGHPLGLFPSSPESPRVVITNGMMVPHYSTQPEYDRLYAMGCTQYGQMTAGSFCYIGPQGIVHGTAITLLNAGRLYLDVESLAGKLFVSAGLGGMSGAQPKAARIVGAVCVIAEVAKAALEKRLGQGWLDEYSSDLEQIILWVRQHKAARTPRSIGYLGNVVDLLEALATEQSSGPECLVDLASDQTSLHNPFGGGYYPVGLSVEEANRLISADLPTFKAAVEASLRRHVDAVNRLCAGGTRFWDYGNAFLLQAGRAEADIWLPAAAGEVAKFKYPSYFEDIMGDIFSLGFGPFRWVCCSGKEADLVATDRLALDVMRSLLGDCLPESRGPYADNITWIEQAHANRLVVGSQARILYSDKRGRVAIARAFSEAVRSGVVSAPIVLSRDHHDVSGTDSPFRETANITDGSNKTADMSVQTFVGNAMRGATWVSLHNGGGTGWGEAMNGGFGMLLDGSPGAEAKALAMLEWDVCSGVARRCWSENPNASRGVAEAMADNILLRVTVPNFASDEELDKIRF